MRDLPKWIVPVVALVVLLVCAGTLLGLWWWLDGTGLTGKDFATAKLEAVKIGLSIAVGGGGLFALYLAVRRQRTIENDLYDRRKAQLHTENDSTERRITELYAKAADQLGSQMHTVRLAGLYALERLAQGNPEHRQTIVNLLCAYLRIPHSPPLSSPARGIQRPLQRNRQLRSASPPETRGQAHRNAVLEQDVRLAAQRILSDHLRPSLSGQPNPRFWPEIDLDLTGANLIDFDLSSCTVRSALFRRTLFTSTASFNSTQFTDDAAFTGATFSSDAWFDRASFTSTASFDQASFASTSWFDRALFSGTASFEETEFADAVSFAGTAFDGHASFDDAQFRSTAWFSGAAFQDRGSFRRATFHGLVQFDDRRPGAGPV